MAWGLECGIAFTQQLFEEGAISYRSTVQQHDFHLVVSLALPTKNVSCYQATHRLPIWSLALYVDLWPVKNHIVVTRNSYIHGLPLVQLGYSVITLVVCVCACVCILLPWSQIDLHCKGRIMKWNVLSLPELNKPVHHHIMNKTHHEYFGLPTVYSQNERQKSQSSLQAGPLHNMQLLSFSMLTGK